MSGVTLQLPGELIEKMEARIEARVLERLSGVAAGHAGDRWLRGAKAIADHIDAPVSRVKALSSAKRIPVRKDGSALVAKTSDLDKWIEEGGGKRP
jgi:hypothetical protein